MIYPASLLLSAWIFAFGSLVSPRTFSGIQTVTMPQAAVPEPNSPWMIAGGLGLVLIGVIGRRRSAHQNGKRTPNSSVSTNKA